MAMKLKEGDLDLSKRLNERISFCPGVTSAVRKQYVESARGHYLSALAGLNAGKQERTNICDSADPLSVLKDHALVRPAEAEEMSIFGRPGKDKTVAGVDTSLHSPNIVLKECDRKLQVKMAQFNKTLEKNNGERIAETISIIGHSGHKMETPDTAELENTTTVLPELIGVKGYPMKGSVEGGSLQKMVKFLKVELENLKKEHAELKDKGEGAEFVTRNLHFKHLKSKPELEVCHVNKLAASHASELIPQEQDENDDCKVEGKGLKRENETSKFFGEMAKKHRVAPSFDKAKETMICNFDQNKCIPGKTYDACVSTSESSVRVRFTEDELESSSQKTETLDKPERNKFTAVRGQVDSSKYDHSSEFSIRDYVFSARNKDISGNWPFSQKNLQLCLKHGVKNVLPPFQSFDSMANNVLNRCLIGTTLHSEESKLEARSLGQKRHMVPDTAMNHQWNSDLFPSMEAKELAFKSTAISNSHSEVESVSTNILQPSEVSDEQVAAASVSASASISASASASASAPVVKKMMKSSSTQPSNKKCKVAVKMHFGSSRGVDDITSACTAPSEAMASKICPVCQVFSSSSNTTLNAHIDQCLSSQSPPNWMNNSKLVKPRIKARKMRSMADICATAPCCTLEDLDRRNGTNWATNTEFFSQDTSMVTQGKRCGVSARHVNNGDDGSVYIDSNGRKIRILSKFNDISSSSSHKVKEDARPKKQSKFGKASKFFSPKRKGRFGKHLKYLKASQQRKILSYRKLKCYLNEALGSAEATSTGGEKLVNGQQQAPFVKASGQKNVSVSGTLKLWISSKRSIRSKKNDPKGIHNPCSQASKYLQPGCDPVDTDMIAKKPLRSPKKSLHHLQSGVRTRILYQTESAQNSENSSGTKAFCSRSMEPSTRDSKDPCLVPMKLGAVQSGLVEEVSKSTDSAASPASSIEREVEFQAEAGENANSSFPNSRELSDGSHLSSCEGIRSNNAEVNNRPKSVTYIHAGQFNSKQKSPALERSIRCGKGMMRDTQSTKIRPHSDPLSNYRKICKITNSLGHTLRLQRKREFVCNQNGSCDNKKTCGHSDEIQGNHGRERSSSTPISSLAFAEAVMDSKRSLDPESQNVIDVPDPLLKSLQYFDPLPSSCQPSSSDDDEMFHGRGVSTERLELKTGVSDFDACQHLFPEVDPIPIPGPPGSDLPSFSDMDSEDLHRTSSLNSSLAQSSGDGDDEVNGNQSDSPLSATSLVSNLGISADPTLLPPSDISGSNNVYPGWYGASFGHTMVTSEMFSELAATGRERTPSQVENSEDKINVRGRGHPISEECSRQSSCLLKEVVPWNATLNLEESQVLGQKMETFVAMPTGKLVGSTLNEGKSFLDGRNMVLSLRSETSCQPMEGSTAAAVSLSRGHDCVSANPAPILRLMGKDLMVVNKGKDDISMDDAVHHICTNRQVHPGIDLYHGLPRSWQHQPHEATSFVDPLVHAQVPDIVSMQHFEGGSSDMMNHSRNPKQLSDVSMYFDKSMHANLSALGAAPLQR